MPLAMAVRVFPGYKFKKGQTFEYLLSQKQKLNMSVINLGGEIEQTNKYTMHFEVKEADKKEVNLIFKLKSFELFVSDLNSTQSLNTSTPAEGIDSLISKHIINRTYFIRMDKYGNVVSITPPQLSIKPYNMDTIQYDALMEFADKENIKSLINQVFMVYPRNDIFPDDSWSNINHLDAGIPILETSSMEISKVSKGVNHFNINGNFSLDTNRMVRTNADAKKILVNGSLKGEVKTKTKKGITISKVWEGEIEGELWMEGNKVLLKNKLNLSVQLLD